jgi:deoxyribonuclease-4
LADEIISIYNIGSHMKKQPSIAGTIASLPPGRPSQIFLGNPQGSAVSATDSDLAAAAAAIGSRKVFVHSPYIVNLCAKEDKWQSQLLRKNLQYTGAFGGLGVVVHVGKSTSQPLTEALQNMRAMLQRSLDAATPACPLLLETPAGQGTETLKGMGEFLDFVESFADPRLRVCLDTCHVFACGHDPVEYLKETLKRPGLLKLVHYNDSEGACKSCVDRHAFVGTGKIGLETMRTIAQLCHEAAVPMVIE